MLAICTCSLIAFACIWLQSHKITVTKISSTKKNNFHCFITWHNCNNNVKRGYNIVMIDNKDNAFHKMLVLHTMQFTQHTHVFYYG